MRLLNRLNTPRAVLVVLTIAIAVNVLIFGARGTEPLDSISQSAGAEQPRDPQTPSAPDVGEAEPRAPEATNPWASHRDDRGEDATGAPRGEEENTPLAAERQDAEEVGTEETQPRAAEETDRGGGEEADRRGRSGEEIAGRRDSVGLAAQSPGTLCTWERVYERPAGAASTVFAGRWATVDFVKRATWSAWSWVATVTEPVWGLLWGRDEAPARRTPDTAAPKADGAVENATDKTAIERSPQGGQQTGDGQHREQPGAQYEQQQGTQQPGAQYEQQQGTRQPGAQYEQQQQQKTSGGQYGRQTEGRLEQTGGTQ